MLAPVSRQGQSRRSERAEVTLLTARLGDFKRLRSGGVDPTLGEEATSREG